MGFIKDIKDIKQTLKDLTKTSTEKANLYDKTLDMLSTIQINVDSANLVFNSEDGTYAVKVEYSIPPVMIYTDGDGKILTNERFKSINMLNLVSFPDMDKIQQKITEMKEKNKR